MKKYIYSFTFILIIFTPVIIFAYISHLINKNVFLELEFWYGYMAYFGTASLAVVSFWQSENANKINERLTRKQMQQKIGYLDLKEAENRELKLNKYQKVQVGQAYDLFENKPLLNCLILNVVNIGEDVILNPRIVKCKINGQNVNVSCLIGMIALDETIKLNLGIVDVSNNKTLKIKLSFEMKNLAGIKYRQKLDISLNKIDNNENTYLVNSFNTEILFDE